MLCYWSVFCCCWERGHETKTDSCVRNMRWKIYYIIVWNASRKFHWIEINTVFSSLSLSILSLLIRIKDIAEFPMNYIPLHENEREKKNSTKPPMFFGLQLMCSAFLDAKKMPLSPHCELDITRSST